MGSRSDRRRVRRLLSTDFVLNSTDDVEAFKQEAGALLPQYYRVVANTDQYEQIAGGFTRLGVIANYIVIIASIATIFIISLVVLLFLRDRKQELGIYLSLGKAVESHWSDRD